MNRKEITSILSKALEYHLNPHNDPRIYMSKEVTFDYGTSTPIRVDYMRFKPVNMTASGIEKGDFYCYEVKSCKEDFKSKNGHNFIGDYNYYVMPSGLYERVKDEIPWNIGVYEVYYGHIFKDKVECIKKAKRKDRDRSINEMLLMMYRSNQRDLLKRSK